VYESSADAGAERLVNDLGWQDSAFRGFLLVYGLSPVNSPINAVGAA
jgi:hypothetical protein